jgi:hypothetical protein
MVDGGFVHLPAGATLDAPVVLVFLASGARPARLASPRTLVVAAEGARATIAEVFLGEEGVYLTNAVTELVLGEGAEVEHVRLQDESRRAFHVGVVVAEQQAKASLAAHALSLGGRLSRSELRSRLVESRRASPPRTAYMTRRRAARGQLLLGGARGAARTTIETYKGVLDGHARGVFSGRIRALPGAQKTVARQMNSEPAPSEDAIVDTKPQLEIFADDVKCGHGGTVGQLTRPRSSTCDRAACRSLRRAGSSSMRSRERWWSSFCKRRCSGRRRRTWSRRGCQPARGSWRRHDGRDGRAASEARRGGSRRRSTRCGRGDFPSSASASTAGRSCTSTTPRPRRSRARSSTR